MVQNDDDLSDKVYINTPVWAMCKYISYVCVADVWWKRKDFWDKWRLELRYRRVLLV